MTANAGHLWALEVEYMTKRQRLFLVAWLTVPFALGQLIVVPFGGGSSEVWVGLCIGAAILAVIEIYY